MPLGTVSVYGNYHRRCRAGFWASPIEHSVQTFNSEDFKREFNDYIERKRQEDRWYKVTWLQDKENFKTKIFKMVDRYEESKRSNRNVDYFRDKIAKKFKSTAYAYGGMRAQMNNSDGSEMSKILMKWYYRITQNPVSQEKVNQVTEASVPNPA